MPRRRERRLRLEAPSFFDHFADGHAAGLDSAAQGPNAFDDFAMAGDGFRFGKGNEQRGGNSMPGEGVLLSLGNAAPHLTSLD